ncbi:MAG: helix-turn-helix domain-containing protein [Stackebrandtia sp.]
MPDPQKIAEMRQDLGKMLAKYRKAAGYRQEDVTDPLNYGRSTIANVETGRQNVPRKFWEQADQLLDADGALLGAYEHLQTSVKALQSHDAQAHARDQCDGDRLQEHLQAEVVRQRPQQESVWAPQTSGTTSLLSQTSLNQDGIQNQGLTSAREHAMLIAMNDVPPILVDQLEAEVNRHAYSYANTAPLVLLRTLEDTRVLTCKALETSRRPVTTTRLLTIAAQTCGLAATTAFDLGVPSAAEEYAQAAYVYADFCGQPEIREWIRSVQATLAFWGNDPQAGLGYALDGLRTASGQTAARLHAIASRAWSMTGDSEAATRSLERAHEMIDAPGPSLPGELDFSHARLALCSAAVYVALDDGQAASHYANSALQLYEQSPQTQQRYAVAYGARMELAAARIIDGNAEAVSEVLEPALSLPPKLRTSRLTRRLNVIRQRLGAPELQSAREVRQVRARIEDFRLRSLPAQAKAIEANR